jgi:hypothetical protein
MEAHMAEMRISIYAGAGEPPQDSFHTESEWEANRLKRPDFPNDLIVTALDHDKIWARWRSQGTRSPNRKPASD